ncbi:MAG TPA: glutathione S-transferase family protein [Alphaproteobacteria bacterium]|nr:glutathione S-transferase family protein [Alphaproteobacteria bacterium]
MRYELYYWAEIQGRGEFVRLALEEAGADYVDVARLAESEGGGDDAVVRMMDAQQVANPAFAPPYLRAGRLVIGQTANILLFLGDRHKLAPSAESGRLWTHQLQLTIADLVQEVHDTHHPIASALYYEDQKPEARRRAEDFLENRAPKYLGYFDGILVQNGDGRYLIGRRTTYADLSLFQIVEGLRYAFPKAMKRLERRFKRVSQLHDFIGEKPRIRAYLESTRRIPFNQMGIFRRYAELDRKR